MPPGNTGTPITVANPYTITENFEAGTKGSYAAADIILYTGSWNFNDALIGNLAADVKSGAKSVRLRGGDIHMNFDINGLNKIIIKHAKYGTDAASTWQLSMSSDGGATYTNVGSAINETSTTLVTDSFTITTTTKVRFKIAKTGTTRINIDDITFKGIGDAGVTVGVPDTQGPDTTSTSNPAGNRGVTIGSDAPPTVGDNSNILFGNPSGAQASMVFNTNYLIDAGYYIESYSNVRGTPNWVSWHLDATNTTNATGRQDNFAGYAGLDPSWYTVQSNSYQGSGFDRGHNCPSADRTSSVNANSATFLMTNMIPQAPNNNQKAWADLEGYLRQQVVAGNEVYIIMGSYGVGGVGSASATSITNINGGKIAVPSNVWKVAVIIPTGNGDVGRVTNLTRVIAVNTPNINSIGADWKNYIVSVRDIETATGYNLLSALPKNVQDAVETKRDAGN
ncbi:DNA/RNA non-specific endonuclease [Mucilaginibacter antarcticus]|uniref:DNA/RNA non-specific endonuclease n=1 Tax=Mucilaginibacter antarcticus TaxID=1855725 RepID=UPI003645F0B9